MTCTRSLDPLATGWQVRLAEALPVLFVGAVMCVYCPQQPAWLLAARSCIHSALNNLDHAAARLRALAVTAMRWGPPPCKSPSTKCIATTLTTGECMLLCCPGRSHTPLAEA